MSGLALMGKVAVVTGAASGLGFAAADRLAAAGAAVLLVDADGGRAAAKAKLIGAPALSMEADVSSDADKIIRFAIETFGRVDALVNNAGIYPRGRMLNTDRALWDRVMAVNLDGLAFCAQAAAKHMVHRGGGKIVNLASIRAISPSPNGTVAYDTSKGAVIAFTRSLALELAPHQISVNAIAPGIVVTEGVAHLADPTAAAATARGVPMGRLGRPEDVAGLVVALCSSLADYITGQVIAVDGGILLTSTSRHEPPGS
jgi:NAD(P)-dependent dehydrogenase (short-subunit alcohol dehydrogenase family)